MKVQGKYIKKPSKPLEDYENKVKAWRLIGKPLTFTKVLHGARMERRRIFLSFTALFPRASHLRRLPSDPAIW